jgi:signal transduction histidine kinase/ligand-binding sensor domain-containing protein/DNA-binding response OmpR family regulator
MRFKICVLTILISFVHLCLFAQKNEYKFSHLDISNGLANNHVSWIYKDQNGFMWFCTQSGLNRYDGYKFKVFKHEIGNINSLANDDVVRIDEGPDNKMWVYTQTAVSIYDSATESFTNDLLHELLNYKVMTDQLTCIKKDSGGNYWFLTKDKGAYCYHPKTHRTNWYTTSGNSKIVLHSDYVSDIVEAGDKLQWLIYNDGVIDAINTQTNTVVLRDFGLNYAQNRKPEKYSAIMGNDHNLWIYSRGACLGVYCYSTTNKTLQHFDKETDGLRLNSNVVNNIVQGEGGNLWVGTDHGGINIIDLQKHTVTYLLNRNDDTKSLCGNSVILYKDSSGIIWVGTFKEGISYFHKNIIQFPLTRHYESNINSLPYEDVNCFVEDSQGNLWIGTNGGGLLFYNKTTKKYTQFKHDPSNTGSLSNDIIVNLFIDHENKLWIGTYFGGLDRLQNKAFIHYRHNDADPTTISDDRIYSIIEDSSFRIWVGTFTGGLNIYNGKTNTFEHPHYPLSSGYNAVLYYDRQKNIWIGTDKGIDVIEKRTGKVKHYHSDNKNLNSLIANDVNSITQDRNGLFWIGTKDGLSIFDQQQEKFTNIDEKKGLPSNNISTILEDNNGLMWISSGNGLASIKLIKATDSLRYEIHKYDEFDGLQGKEYNAIAALKTRSGELIFGGAHGFNSFNPNNIHAFAQTPKLILTDLQLFNQSVKVGNNIGGRVVLQNAISSSHTLVLNHNENVFSVEFAALDYFNPGKITYQYKLENFDTEWLSSPADLRKATYTNLNAGDYVFRVKASNTNNPGNTSELLLKIKILPPFWKTSVAYLLYIVFVISLLLYIRHRGILKIKMRFEAKQNELEADRQVAKEREEARHMHELDLMKIEFFTNVSHEFRTPLSLIHSPIENLIKHNDKPEQQLQLLMIRRNGRRLLNLVNQLLDFRKMEFGELKLNLTTGDIVKFIEDACSSFTDIAEQNRVTFLFDTEIIALNTSFDEDKIERVLFNLLSNSFKFTCPGGHISVFLSLAKNEGDLQDERMLEIKIMDTGIGIQKENQERIFERFFQDDLPAGFLNQGSGIGLSISREFIKMHKGDIKVESEPGNGSCFTISMPVCIANESCDAVVSAVAEEEAHDIANQYDREPEYDKKPVILLIEDNDDLRLYLSENLKNNFHIIESINGKDGWRKTLALHPDLIVSDILMPEMNGLDLCKKIRQDSRTSHIPIILLTALVAEEDQLMGSANGANDYIAKPFNFEILLSKINGLLFMQQTLKKTYQNQVDIQAQEIEIIPEDQKFLKNTLNYIELNLTDPDFTVEQLSRLMLLSRVSLYKRLLTLTGKTPIECIRTIRLKRAVQLLKKSNLSISNVAYQVGFNDPNYFSRVFKKEYGKLPSEYVNELIEPEKPHFSGF